MACGQLTIFVTAWSRCMTNVMPEALLQTPSTEPTVRWLGARVPRKYFDDKFGSFLATAIVCSFGVWTPVLGPALAVAGTQPSGEWSVAIVVTGLITAALATSVAVPNAGAPCAAPLIRAQVWHAHLV